MKAYLKTLSLIVLLGLNVVACGSSNTTLEETDTQTNTDEASQDGSQNSSSSSGSSGSNSNGSGSSSGTNSGASNPQTAYSSGISELENNNLNAAEEDFCNEYESGNTDSDIVFGCFLTRALLLAETAQAQSLLTHLGQSTIDVDQDILYDIVASLSGENFYYTNYSQLPLRDAVDLFNRGHHRIAYDLIGSDIYTANASVIDIQNDALDLVDHLEELEEMLTILLADTSFTFTIPGEAFYGDDVDVSYNDLRYMMSAVQLQVVAIQIFNAYDWGVMLQDSHDGSVWVDEILVEDLNGTGSTVQGVTVDQVAFMEMIDESLITDSRSRMSSGLSYLYDAIDQDTSLNFTSRLAETVNLDSTETLLDRIQQLIISVDSPGFATVDLSTGSIELDLYEFFTNPPRSSDVTSSDPFVYNSTTGEIEIVESYFEELLDDVARF